jgi:carboxymethylenebutenolidase
MRDDLRQQAIDLYDRFTHDGMERRAFMAEMAKLAGSLAAAELLIAGTFPIGLSEMYGSCFMVVA